MSGRIVFIKCDDGYEAMAETDSEGLYIFNNVPEVASCQVSVSETEESIYIGVDNSVATCEEPEPEPSRSPSSSASPSHTASLTPLPSVDPAGLSPSPSATMSMTPSASAANDCIRGVVRDVESSEPVSGVSVTVMCDPEFELTTITNIQGEYEFIGLPDMAACHVSIDDTTVDVDVEVDDSEATCVHNEPSPSPSPTASLTPLASFEPVALSSSPSPTMSMTPSTVAGDCVHGIVRNSENGAPVPGVEVMITCDPDFEQTRQTNDQGEYEFINVPNVAECQVSILETDVDVDIGLDNSETTCEEPMPSQSASATPSVSPTPSHTASLTALPSVEPAALSASPSASAIGDCVRGIVRSNDNGTPVSGVEVLISCDPAFERSTQTDDQGEYEFDNVPNVASCQVSIVGADIDVDIDIDDSEATCVLPVPSPSSPATPSASVSGSPAVTPSGTVSISPSISPSGSVSISMTPSSTASATASMSVEPSASPTVTPSTSVSPTPSHTASLTALPSVEPAALSPSPTMTPSASAIGDCVRGIVRDGETDEPVVDKSVTIKCVPDYENEVVTDSQGEYLFMVPAGSVCQVAVAQTAAEVDVEVEDGVEIETTTVICLAPSPSPSATVSPAPATSASTNAPVTPTASPSLSKLPDVEPVALSPSPSATASPSTTPVADVPDCVRGVVRDAQTGQPAANVDVVIECGNGFKLTVKTDQNGEYNFDIVPDVDTCDVSIANTDLDVKVDVDDSHAECVETDHIPSPSTSPTISPVGECLRGLLRNTKTNMPIADKGIIVVCPSGYTERKVTDENGEYVFYNIAEGSSCQITVEGDDIELDFDVTGTGAECPEPTTPISDQCLSGMVKDSNGAPVVGQSVVVKCAANFEMETLTDSNGEYNFSNLPASADCQVSITDTQVRVAVEVIDDSATCSDSEVAK
ncbi:hypothetical protein SARC_13565 [Sphaeroforma arctica JP610]|uniref:SD-repeat containing protein B domain-containing protein n=1 Tax=Sphaeroforma arctica JP610 TaxID=667725 RepID=A0A0L0FBJ7_9EUKA|nr:hypothetical protein SARC_13565 [Sphaeroforma arctica JP610]KNC73876.1 hypothetical protein SARC_13565 [Sphaeroforma arctica JP610]|eukprot:XP_014147778.1 hypothetical protein SARC_13565 [Sphaeroforma arctica JP610]